MQRRIIVLLAIFTIWLGICAFVFGYFLDFFEGKYFRFGPSDDLSIVGISIQIDTWGKYTLLALYQFIDPLVSVAVSDLIWPWINSSVMNPDKKTISVPKWRSWCIVNYFWIAFSIKGLFSLGISMSQIDLFVIGTIGFSVSGAVTSFVCIWEKEYKPNSDDDEDEGEQAIKDPNNIELEDLV